MPSNKLKNKNLKLKDTTNKTKIVSSKTKPTTKKAAGSDTRITRSLSVILYGVDGRKKGSIKLSKQIFGTKVNESLMLQAVHVYLTNQRQGTANTKTRGEVKGSTRKIYRQKGTGRARHGAITAPIFVGGGIAFGPRTRQFDLKLSKQMRKKALFSALSQKIIDQKVLAIDEGKLSGKTKEEFNLFKKITDFNKNKADKILFVSASQNAVRGARNIDGVKVVPPHSINTYEVLNSKYLIIGKEALTKIEDTFLNLKGTN